METFAAFNKISNEMAALAAQDEAAYQEWRNRPAIKEEFARRRREELARAHQRDSFFDFLEDERKEPSGSFRFASL